MNLTKEKTEELEQFNPKPLNDRPKDWLEAIGYFWPEFKGMREVRVNTGKSIVVKTATEHTLESAYDITQYTESKREALRTHAIKLLEYIQKGDIIYVSEITYFDGETSSFITIVENGI